MSVPPLLPYSLGRRQVHRTLGGSQGHGLDPLLCHRAAGRPRRMLPTLWASCLSPPQGPPENTPPPRHRSCCPTGLLRDLSSKRTLLSQFRLPLFQASVRCPSLPCPLSSPVPYATPLQCWIGSRFSGGSCVGGASFRHTQQQNSSLHFMACTLISHESPQLPPCAVGSLFTKD